MPRRSDCLTRSGFDRRKLPVSSNPRAEHAPTRLKPPAALIEGLKVMREARDEPGWGGPHGVSLHAECLFLPFRRIGAGAAFFAQRTNDCFCPRQGYLKK